LRPSRAFALLLLVASGCATSRLPDYALPQVQVVDPQQLAKTDGVAYRKLTRADFRGAKSPRAGEHGELDMTAYTCANIATQRGIDVDLRQPGPGEPFVARPMKVAFVARMDRDCSWWNPQPSGESQEYVLQHEQIHFAIVELAARDLTRRTQQLTATGDSPQAAAAALQRRLDTLFQASIDAMAERQKRFDLDTSGRNDAKLQQRWFDDVMAELAR
jgi:hypothetical protein